MRVKTVERIAPKIRAVTRTWRVIILARSNRRPPMLRAIKTAYPIANAFIHPLTSQIVEVGTLTAAVAAAPREPTIAESTYVTET